MIAIPKALATYLNEMGVSYVFNTDYKHVHVEYQGRKATLETRYLECKAWITQTGHYHPDYLVAHAPIDNTCGVFRLPNG